MKRLHPERLVEMDMYISDVTEPYYPFGMLQQSRPVYIIHHAHSTIATPCADDRLDLRVIDSPLKVRLTLIIRTCKLVICETYSAAEFHL